MRRLIVSELVTLDGVMEAPGGEPGHPERGWVKDFTSEEQLRYKLDEVLEADSLLLGRITYESFAAAWPGGSGEFADKMNTMPKHVVSTTLREPSWPGTQLIEHDIPISVARLKEQDGGPILVAGSRTLVHTLLQQDLIDEYRLMVFPVILGGGQRLFPDKHHKIVLRLLETRTFATGVVVQTYTPETPPSRT